MSRISVPPVASATGPVAEIYARIGKTVGSVPNLYAAIGALQPAVLHAVLDAEAVLASGSLTRPDIETVKLTVSAATECDYCVAAHSLHMDGKAMDVRLNGIQLSNLHKAALSLRKGGVGYYPTSNFVHVDVGRVRTWQGV